MWERPASIIDVRRSGAARQLRRRGSRVVIIAVTASGLAPAERDSQEAGIDGFLRKPFRDEELFADPFAFRVDRRPNRHLAFGIGEHTCMGLHLARMETRVALECLLDRLTDITLITEDNPHIHGQPFRSPTALPVTFAAAG